MTFKEFVESTGMIKEAPAKIDINKLFQNYSIAFDEVQQRTSYGRRKVQAIQKSYAASWSNAWRRWDVYRGFIKQGEFHNLDANVILIPAKTQYEAKLIAAHLPPLPLDAFSYENNPLAQLDPNASPEDTADAIDKFTNIKPTLSNKKEYFDKMLDAYNSGFKI